MARLEYIVVITRYMRNGHIKYELIDDNGSGKVLATMKDKGYANYIAKLLNVFPYKKPEEEVKNGKKE